jgi:hypothetical protein
VNKSIKRATLIMALTPLMSIPTVSAIAGTTTPVAPVASTVTAPVTHTVTKAVPSTVRDSGSSGSSATGTATSTSTDAPSSTASASAAKVSGIIAIGDTSATAGSTNTGAHADSLDLLGSRVTGGDAKGNAKDGGNLLGTGNTPLGDVEVLPWSVISTQSDSASNSQAEAALAHAGLLGVLQLWLLHSQSQTSWTPAASSGSASSDGGEVNLDNQLDVKVLHADASSDGKSSSALLVINGQQIISSSDANGSCAVNVDPLLSLLCLQASGGTGTAAASVADLTSKATGLTSVVTGTTSSGGKVAAPATTSVQGSRTPAEQSGPLPHTNGPAAGKLPFTGTESALLALYGALLTALGAGITVAARRRPGAAPG